MARRLPPAEVRILAKDQTRSGIRSAEGAIGGMAKRLGKTLALGAVGLGFQRMVSSQLKALDAIGKSATQFNIATESVSSLTFAAEQSGLTFDTFSTAMRTGAKNVGEAAQGIGMAKEELKELGLSARELNSLAIDEQFRRIVRSLTEVQNQGDKTRIAMAIFGRSGSEILKAANDLSDLEAEAVKLGITFSEDTVRGAEAANDAMNRVKKTAFATAVNFTDNLYPAIEYTADYMIDTMPKVGRVTSAALTMIYSSALLAQAGFLMVKKQGVESAEPILKVWSNMPKVLKKALTSFIPIPGLSSVLANTEEGFGIKDTVEQLGELEAKIDGIFHTIALLNGDLIADLKKGVKPALSEVSSELGDGDGDGIYGKLQRINITARKLPAYMTSWQSAAQEGGRGMARNLEQFFFNPAEEGIQGFAKSMLGTLRQIAARIATIKLLSAIFKGTSFAKYIPGYADGGRPAVGQMSIVGERGPELFIPDRAGTIIPNSKLGGMGAGVSVVNNVTIEAGTDARIVSQMPAILEQNKRETMAELLSLMHRGRATA